jgi:hypothetical protein
MMKRTIAVAGAAAVLGVAGGALAANTPHLSAVVLKPGQAVYYSGLTCTAYAAKTAANANLVCVRNDLKGFGVIVSQSSVIVAKQTGSHITVVFKTKNG